MYALDMYGNEFEIKLEIGEVGEYLVEVGGIQLKLALYKNRRNKIMVLESVSDLNYTGGNMKHIIDETMFERDIELEKGETGIYLVDVGGEMKVLKLYKNNRGFIEVIKELNPTKDEIEYFF